MTFVIKGDIAYSTGQKSLKTVQDGYIVCRDGLSLGVFPELPEIYRKAILLYYYNGFTTAEIAKILHCPQSTVNVRLKRGRDMLRRTLGE